MPYIFCTVANRQLKCTVCSVTYPCKPSNQFKQHFSAHNTLASYCAGFGVVAFDDTGACWRFCTQHSCSAAATCTRNCRQPLPQPANALTCYRPLWAGKPHCSSNLSQGPPAGDKRLLQPQAAGRAWAQACIQGLNACQDMEHRGKAQLALQALRAALSVLQTPPGQGC